MKGIYVCFNEDNNGGFEEAVKLSNDGYLMWRHPNRIAQNLKYRTQIIIKMSGEHTFYIGDLLLTRNYEDFNPKIFHDDIKHRPAGWRNDKNSNYKSVLFIANLKEVAEPKEIKGLHPPQGFTYIDVKEK